MVKLIALICALNLKSYNANMDLSLKFHTVKGIYLKTSIKNITNIDNKSLAFMVSYGLKNVIFKFIGIEYCKSSKIFYAVVSVNFLFFLHINFKIGYNIVNNSCVASIEAETNTRMINCAVNMNKTVANSKELKELNKVLNDAIMQKEHMLEKTHDTISQTTNNILTLSVSDELFTRHKEYKHAIEGLIKTYMHNNSDKHEVKKLIIELSLRFQYLSDIERMKMEFDILKQSNECTLVGFEVYYQELKIENEKLINEYNDFSDVKKNENFFVQINLNQEKITFMEYAINCKKSGASIFTFEKLDQYSSIFANNPECKKENEICLKEKQRMTEQLMQQCLLEKASNQILKKQIEETEQLKISLDQYKEKYENLKKEQAASEARLKSEIKKEKDLIEKIYLNENEIEKLKLIIEKKDCENVEHEKTLLNKIEEINKKNSFLKTELDNAKKLTLKHDKACEESKKNEKTLKETISKLEENEKKLNNYIKSNADLLQKLSASNDQLKAIETEKANMENNHKIEIKKMIEEHNIKIEESSKTAAENKEKEIKKLQKNHEQALIDLDSSCNNLIDKIKKEKEMLLKILNESKDQNEAYQTAAKKIEDEHRKEKEQIEQEYKEKIKQLSKTIADDHANELKQVREKALKESGSISDNCAKQLKEMEQKLIEKSNYQEQIKKEYQEALKKSEFAYNDSIKGLKQRIEELKNANQDQKNKYEAELQNIKINNEKEKEKIKKQYENDIKKISEESEINIQKQIKELQKKHENDLKNFNLMHDNLKKQLKTMSEELEQLKIKNQKESEKNLKNELEVKNLRQKFESTTATVEAGKRKIEQLNKVNLNLNDQLLSISTSNKTLQDQLFKNEEKIQSLVKELEAADLKSANDINKSLQELKKSKEELQKQIKSNSDLESINKELKSKSKEEKDILSKQLNSLTASISSSFHLIRTDSNSQSLSEEINNYLSIAQNNESGIEERLKNFIKLHELYTKKIEKRIKEQEEINKKNVKDLEKLDKDYKIAIKKFDDMKKTHEEYIKLTDAKNKKLIEQHEAEMIRVKEEAEREFKRKIKEENERNVKILQASSNENMDLKLKLAELNKIISDLKSSGDIQAEKIKNLQNQLANKSIVRETYSHTHSRKLSNKNNASSSASYTENQDSDHLVNNRKDANSHFAINDFKTEKSTQDNICRDRNINFGKSYQETKSTTTTNSECGSSKYDGSEQGCSESDDFQGSDTTSINTPQNIDVGPNNKAFYPSARDVESIKKNNISKKKRFKRFNDNCNNVKFNSKTNRFAKSEIVF